MDDFKDWCRKFWTRLNVAWDILVMNERHWLFISLNRKQLVKLIKSEEFTATTKYHGLRPYLCHRIVQMINNGIDEDEMILKKAAFEGEALYNAKNKENNV